MRIGANWGGLGVRSTIQGYRAHARLPRIIFDILGHELCTFVPFRSV